MKFDIANEDKAIEKIQSMKLELKELEKKSREYEEKLKEQRLTYSNLNSTINKIIYYLERKNNYKQKIKN